MGKLLLLLLAFSVSAAEIDNYSMNGFESLRDSTDEWNEHVNRVLGQTIDEWKPKWGNDKAKFAEKFYKNLDGNQIKNKTNPWCHRNLSILEIDKKDSIYSLVPFTTSPIFSIFGVAFNLRFGDLAVGVDKLTHYLGAGYIMYKKAYVKGKGPAAAIKWAGSTESGYLGMFITRTYSNGDIVADYEGMRFFKALFDSDVFPNKGPYLKFDDGHITQLRSYDIHEYLTPFWNEAINPSDYGPKTKEKILEFLPRVCDLFEIFPHYYQLDPSYRTELEERYAHLPIRYNYDLLLENVCK